MNSYTGNYIGIVVQNNDPEKRGRVKVYVPHVNAAVYEKWYGVKQDKSYRFAGRNIDSNLSDILSDLKTILPWADQAAPLASQSSTGRYNAYNDVASVSDTNTLTNFTPVSGFEPKETSLNDEGIGESPAKKYEIEGMRLHDAFDTADRDSLTGAKRPNKYSYSYRPHSYSNAAKGVFCIPDVGAHVWVFFREGDPQHPTYWGTSLGQDDWTSVYGNEHVDSTDYPGSYENHGPGDSPEQDINIETYRNKFLINHKGGTLEFVNTDNREILRMTHYSGSFKEFNNQTSIELATGNDQKLVLQDQYITVNGYGGCYVGRDLDNIIQGDHFLRVGKQAESLHKAWRETAREMHHIKQLFEKQRANTDADKGVVPGAFVSPLQALSSETNTVDCPVCTTSSPRADVYHSLNEAFASCSVNETTSTAGGGSFGSNPTADSTETSDGTSKITAEYLTSDIVTPLVNSGSNIFGEACPSCDGKGKILGSMDGAYADEPLKQSSTWLNKAKEIIGKLADIEAGIGMGGSEVINIAKHKTQTIGMVMNDFGSVRVDTKGKFYKNGVQVLDEGVINTRVTSPLIEYVHVDDIPGGSYTLNVCNRWNVQVGAGGVSMKSYGPVDIGGTITNIGGTQVNIGSENEVNIDGGSRVNIVGDILTLRQRDGKQVLVDSNLGVTKNVVIGGGMHVEGELCVNHVTAPCEIQETEKTVVWSYLLAGLEFECTLDDFDKTDSGLTGAGIHNGAKGKITLNADSNHDLVKSYAHSHHFKNLPLHLKHENKGVRAVSKTMHDSDRAQPADREFVASESKST